MVESLDVLDCIVGQVQALEVYTFIQSFDFRNFVFVKPQIFKLAGILESLNGKRRYLDMSDSTVNESKRFEASKATDDVHVAEILEDKFNGVDFVDFLHVAFFESVHAFLREEKGTIRSRREESDFFGMTFSVFSYFPKSICIYLNYL